MAKPTGRPVGRPREIKSPEEFDAKVDAYVAERRAEGKRPLLTGIMIALGIYDYSTFYEYENYEGFSKSVSRARAIVADAYEDCLAGQGSPQGAMFALKNIKDRSGGPAWRDKIEVEHGGSTEVNINIMGWGAGDDEEEESEENTA